MVAIAIVAIGIQGCAAEVEEAPLLEDGVAQADVVERIDAETFAGMDDDVEVWLDLRETGRRYTVDTDAVPLERIALICPNGQVMSWTDWVASDPGLTEHAQGLVALAADPDLAALALDGALDGAGEGADEESDESACRTICYDCPDGVTICRPSDRCGVGAPTQPLEPVFEDPSLWQDPGGDGEPIPYDPFPGSGGGDSGGGGSGREPAPTPPSGGGGGGSGGGSGSGGSGSSGSGSSGGGGSTPGGHPGW